MRPYTASVQSDADKLPRSIRKGPPITITCECGQRRSLRYGEQWRCERCGRRWNTLRIPLEEYAAIRAAAIRVRRLPLLIASVVFVCVVAFIVVGKAFGGLILAAFAISAWGMFARPLYRRRYRRELGDRPTWKLKPEK